MQKAWQLVGPHLDRLYCVSIRGKAKDIRKVVQRLNKKRLCPEEQQNECQFGAGSEDLGHDECHGTRGRELSSPQNRWKEYLDSSDSDSDGQKSRSILASRYVYKTFICMHFHSCMINALFTQICAFFLLQVWQRF